MPAILGGPSPRLRGTRVPKGREAHRGRSIPAPAGNTKTIFSGLRPRSVHPRACGEHPRRPGPWTPVCGPSPRLRGTLDTLGLKLLEHRSIPAPAGNTTEKGTSRELSTVHPRACGEHLFHRRRQTYAPGPSPRLRGTPVDVAVEVSGTRSIPAPAGNTSHLRIPRRKGPVHPRACGEHAVATRRYSSQTGPSPRLRGTQARHTRWAGICRSIPAPAGNTVVIIKTRIAPSVHPRACGEHSATRQRTLRNCGPSPRLRGTRHVQGDDTVPDRSIPAPAGNTLPGPWARATRSVHPRACGEHRNSGLYFTAILGPSPRLRGTRRVRVREHRGQRSIPAPAGNTS